MEKHEKLLKDTCRKRLFFLSIRHTMFTNYIIRWQKQRLKINVEEEFLS